MEAVVQYSTKTGEAQNVYISASAANEYGFDSSTIIKCIRGDRMTHGESRWARLPQTQLGKIKEYKGKRIPRAKFSAMGLKVSPIK